MPPENWHGTLRFLGHVHPDAVIEVVAALALALRCDSDERDHLFHLAGLTPPPRQDPHERQSGCSQRNRGRTRAHR